MKRFQKIRGSDQDLPARKAELEDFINKINYFEEIDVEDMEREEFDGMLENIVTELQNSANRLKEKKARSDAKYIKKMEVYCLHVKELKNWWQIFNHISTNGVS